MSTNARPAAAVMSDVARLAGVSHQTVSRVINDHPNVRPETRLRVRRAIEQLDYRPNTAARLLVTRQSKALGVVSVDTAHYGPSSTIFAIAEAARLGGYFLNFASLTEVDTANMSAAFDYLLGASVDGIVVIAPVQGAVDALHGLRSDVPVIQLGDTRSASSRGLLVDQAAGARMATSHLLDLGHRKVFHISGPKDWLEATARVRGWRDELAARSIDAPPVQVGDWSVESGYDAGRALSKRKDVTAVFVANDQMALGVVRALQEGGRAVPEDVSVVGFDDVPEAAYYGPPLTTLRQDFAEVGRRCVAAVIAEVRGTHRRVEVPVRPELIVRASTGRASKPARRTSA